MKGRIFFTTLLVVVLATSFLMPYTAAQEEVDPVAAELAANEVHRQNPPFRADEPGPLSRQGGTPDTVLYFWDFEGTNGGFAGTLDWEWGTYAWAGTCGTHYEPPAAYSGTDMWGTVLNECYHNLGNNSGYSTCINDNPADDSILSFTIDLTGVTEPVEMSWWEWFDLYMNWDWGEVYANGNVVFQHCGTGYIIPTAWEQQVVDLTPYIGGLVDIEFHMMASTVVERAGWWIDDLMVYTLEVAPNIVVDAPPLDVELCPDATETLTFTICNTGDAPLEWTLIETTTMLSYLDETVVVDVPAVEARPGIASRVEAFERPTRQFEMHIGWVSLQLIDVLIVTPDVVGGGDISLLLNTLAAFPDLNVVVWDGNAGTPTVGDMLGYDVVFVGNDILWTSSAIDKTELSDNLADYIDVGGKVLAGSFVWSFDDWGLGGGRFITDDYSPYEISTQDFWGSIALGAYDAGHPIMAGITDVTEGYNHQDPALSSTGVWVASWQDDENFAAVSPSSVGLNQLHFHQANFGGQTGELLHNALLYLETSAGPDAVPWLSEEPVSGTVGIDECSTVTVTFDSQWMDPGEYYADLIIESNDPDEPEITLPVTMTVLDCTGGLAGYLMDFETGDVDPTCTEAEVYVEPGDLIVPVGPDGYYATVLSEGTYTLTASAPGYAEETAIVNITIGMTTTQDFSLQRPVVGVTPTDFISITATVNEETTYPLVISNTGHQPLDFEIIETPVGGMSILEGGAAGYLTTWLEGDVEIDPLVFAELDARGTTAFFVQMRLQADLSPAYDIQDWNIRGQYVYNSLRSAAEAQNPVIDYAQSHGLTYETRLSYNSVFVKGGTLEDVEALAARADVKQIRANHIYELEEVQAAAPAAYGWNLDVLDPDAGFYGMEAAQVWDWFQVFGEGIVVANIDTGVTYDHEALVRQYRGNNGDGTFDHDFNWYAPTITASVQCGGDAAIAPCDEDNHGSGTAGIMVGETDDLVEQNGVAPGAEWIACMGCDGYGPGGPGGCSEEALTACADWMVAPCPIGVDPGDPACDPDMRPHVVNNSWGGAGCDLWYQAYIQAWVAAGIFPAFSAGNTAICDAVGSPGDTPEAFGTAAHAADGVNLYAGGPSCHFPVPSCSPYAHEMDPHLNAPTFGRTPSNVPGEYYNLSGTSGASPHTAGCVALMWSANPSLIGDIDTTFTILEQSADRSSTQPWAEGDCGKPACAGADTYPNYEYGWGYLDCYTAVEGALEGLLDVPWMWTDPSSGTIEAGEEATIEVTFLCTETQDYSATLRIFHNDPCENSIGVPIVLHCEGVECDPVSGVDFAWVPVTPTVDAMVYLTASVAFGTPPFTYTWDYGDGSTGEGMAVTHVYTAAGDYEVTLLVENACGEASIADTVTVEAGVHYIYLPLVVKNN